MFCHQVVSYICTIFVHTLAVILTLDICIGTMCVLGESNCVPELSEGKHNKLYSDGHISLECVIYTCGSVSKISYERRGISYFTNWTAVFEGINRTYHYPISISDGNYTLENRTDYTDFHTHHILYITHLKYEDQGEWRCVVYDRDNRATESRLMELIFEPTCEPTLSEGKHNKLHVGGHISLECVIFTCDSVSRIRYEKKDTTYPSEWKPVFEAINRTYHYHITEGDTTYTLQNRTDYTDFHSHHILYITNLILADQGEWRCIVYGHRNVSTTSHTMKLDFEPTCKPELSQGNHNRLYLDGHISLECVIFTCGKISKIQYQKKSMTYPTKWVPVFEGINRTHYYPLVNPYITYSLINRTDYTDFYSHHILYITHLKLEDQGDWMCVVYNQRNIAAMSPVMDVHYEVPYIVVPTQGIYETVPANSTFSLKCIAVGYYPRIEWFKDGVLIDDKNGDYVIVNLCVNPRRECENRISSKPLPNPITCEHLPKYQGLYTCSVKIGPYYNDSVIVLSPDMRVDISDPSLKDTNITVGNCNSVDIFCNAGVCAREEDSISWLFEGEEIAHFDNAFSIDEVNSDYIGTYTKNVKLEQGNVSCSVILIYEASMNTCDRKVVSIVISIIVSILLFTLVYFGWRKYRKVREHSTIVEGNSNDTETEEMLNPKNVSETSI